MKNSFWQLQEGVFIINVARKIIITNSVNFLKSLNRHHQLFQMDLIHEDLSKKDYRAILDLLFQQEPKLVRDTITSYRKKIFVTLFELEDISFYFDLSPRYVALLKERLNQRDLLIEGDSWANLDFYLGDLMITKDNVYYDEPVNQDELESPTELDLEVQKRLQQILDGERLW